MKYTVGENVILKSKLMPSLNGQYTITAAHPPSPNDILERTNKPSTEPVYELSGIVGLWVESSLSK